MHGKWDGLHRGRPGYQVLPVPIRFRASGTIPCEVTSTAATANYVDAWQTGQAGCYLLLTMCLEYPKAVLVSFRQSHNSKAGKGVVVMWAWFVGT